MKWVNKILGLFRRKSVERVDTKMFHITCPDCKGNIEFKVVTVFFEGPSPGVPYVILKASSKGTGMRITAAAPYKVGDVTMHFDNFVMEDINE